MVFWDFSPYAYIARANYIAANNQMQAMRKPPMEMTLRSSFDFDGIASDAVEGRNKQLEFYRKRNSGRFER